MYPDPAQVDREVGMHGKSTCVDCHLGNPAALEKGVSHAGLLRPFLVGAGKKLKGEAVSRKDAGAMQPMIVPSGKGISSMILKGEPKKLEAAGLKESWAFSGMIVIARPWPSIRAADAFE